MTIRRGDSPERGEGTNKYIGKHGDGFRGILVAVSPDGTEAVLQVLLLNGQRSDRRILVREMQGPNHYPTEIKDVTEIPPGWTN